MLSTGSDLCDCDGDPGGARGYSYDEGEDKNEFNFKIIILVVKNYFVVRWSLFHCRTALCFLGVDSTLGYVDPGQITPI